MKAGSMSLGLFDPEDGGDILLRNVVDSQRIIWHCTAEDKTAQYWSRWTTPVSSFEGSFHTGMNVSIAMIATDYT
jgi:hypothetical protein